MYLYIITFSKTLNFIMDTRGQNVYLMASLNQFNSNFLAPLLITTASKRGKVIREKKNAHLGYTPFRINLSIDCQKAP